MTKPKEGAMKNVLMKRVKTENNPLLTNMKKKPDEYSPNSKGRGLKKMIIINNEICRRGITYKETYPKMLVEFCTNKRAYVSKKDKETGMMVKQANEYPTIQEFRVKYKIPKSTWLRRSTEYPELREAVEIVKDHQEDMLMKNGLASRWNAQVVKSVGMAEHDWSEKKETTTKHETITDEQKKKMFEEYMRGLEQQGTLIEGEVLNSNDDYENTN